MHEEANLLDVTRLSADSIFWKPKDCEKMWGARTFFYMTIYIILQHPCTWFNTRTVEVVNDSCAFSNYHNIAYIHISNRRETFWLFLNNAFAYSAKMSDPNLYSINVCLGTLRGQSGNFDRYGKMLELLLAITESYETDERGKRDFTKLSEQVCFEATLF